MSLEPRDYYARSRKDRERKRRLYYGENRASILRRCRIYRWKQLGINITSEQYDCLRAQQKERCAICNCSEVGLKKALAVDHNRSTSKVRGLLCMECNVGLGKFKDSLDLLEAAKNYLLNGVKLEYVDAL